jgi:hypothetical protein
MRHRENPAGRVQGLQGARAANASTGGVPWQRRVALTWELVISTYGMQT